jgi:hypothetical protein
MQTNLPKQFFHKNLKTATRTGVDEAAHPRVSHARGDGQQAKLPLHAQHAPLDAAQGERVRVGGGNGSGSRSSR